MAVSFILPAYKRRFLHEAIASILAQTYRDFELVVVDDCSPEDLKSVVDEFHDERLSYHRNETNIGGKDLVAAWSHAMEYAQGEWCVLASDDDVWLPQCLERLVALAEKYPACDLFHARCAYIDAVSLWTDVAPGRLEMESQIQFAYERGVRRAPQQASDFMFRLDAWRKMGGFVNFPLAWHSDDATWMKLARNGCGHTSEVSMCFRNSGINLSANQDRLLLRKIDAGLAYEAWLKEFVRTLTPASVEEAFQLEHLLDGSVRTADGLMVWELAHTHSPRVWLKAVLRKGVSFGVRQRAIRQWFISLLGACRIRNKFATILI